MQSSSAPIAPQEIPYLRIGNESDMSVLFADDSDARLYDDGPCVIETAEGCAQSLPVWQERICPNVNVVHEDGSSQRASQCELVLDSRSRKALCALTILLFSTIQ